MKKILLAGLFSLLAFPSLMSAQVTPVADVDTVDQSSCITLSNNMRYRMRDTSVNNEVSDLQDFLNMSGYLKSGPTGYFGLATFNAVKKFQSASGFTPTGYVGPLTRAKINAMSCGGVTTGMPVAMPAMQVVPTISTPVAVSSQTQVSTTPAISPSLPAGCTSTSRFSPLTGKSCSPVSATTTNLTITTSATLPNAKVGQSYSIALNTSGNTGFSNDYKWSVNNGAAGFPITGLGFSFTNSNTVYIIGTPAKIYIGGVESMIANTFTFNVTVTSGSQSATKQFTLTVDPATNTQTTGPTVEVVGTPTLSLQYDSAGKESTLVANYNVSITAPAGSSFKLYKYGAFDNDTYAFLVNLNDAKGANGASTNGNYYKVSGSAVDNGNYWTISAGQTASFNLTANLSHPKTLFAGSYNATLSLYKPAGGAGIAVNGSSTTNSVTIIGETAPYISSASSFTNSNGYVLTTIAGVRFNQASNIVDIGGKQFDFQSVNGGTVIQFIPEVYGISPGNYTVQVTHPTTGASNKVNVNIGAPTAALTIESIGTPTLSLQYDSAQKESALVANYTVKITAGIQALSFPSYYVNCGGGTPGSFSILSSIGQIAPATACATGPATIPSGTSATYTIKLTANPNQIFAGSYTATLQPGISSLDLGTGQWMTTPLPTPKLIGTVTTNAVTVIGERAPYISSANQVTSSGTYLDQVLVTGVRFSSTANQVTMNWVTKTVATSASDKGPVTWLKLSDFGITTSGVYSVQVSTSEGVSNMVNVNVIVPLTTTTATTTTTTGTVLATFPDLQVIRISPTSVKGGQITTFTATVKNASPVYNIATPFSVSVGGMATVNSLAAGQTTTVSADSGLSLPGSNRFCAIADPLNTVVESDESNNTFCQTVNVSPTYLGEGTFTLNHWDTLQLNNGLILYADGANTYGQTPYKVNFKIYDSNQQVVASTGDLTTGSAWSSAGSIPQAININIGTINVGTYGNANWSVTVTASSFNVAPAGTLSVSTDPSSPSSSIAAAGTNGRIVGAYRFHSTNEAISLNRIGLVLTKGSPADVAQVTVWDGATQVGTGFSTGTNTRAVVNFASAVTIPKDTDKTLTIKADLSPQGVGYTGTPGALVAIDADSANAQGVGQSSGSTIVATGTTSVSGVRVFKSYPTVAIGSLGSTGVADGKLMRFTITANANGGISISKFSFNISPTLASVSGINLFAYTDAGYSMSVSGFSAGQLSLANIQNANGPVVIYPSLMVSVPAGMTYYFELRGTVAPQGTNYVVSTSLSSDSMYAPLSYAANVSGSFVWSPNSAASASTADWTNGYMVPGLPSTGLSQTRTAMAPSSQSQFASVFDAFSPVSAPTPISVPAPTWAYSWTRNLEVGLPYTDDIAALQTALAKEGVYTGEVTGGFYSQTYLAVKAFQAKYGIESTGFVGPTTRAKLNELYKIVNI